jgi:Histidine kinase
VEHPQEVWTRVVAHALHDGPMQTVVSVALELDGLSRAIGSNAPPHADEVRSILARLRGANQHAASELRAIVRQLSEGSVEMPADEASGVEPRVVRSNGSGGTGNVGLLSLEGGAGEVTW